MMADEPTRRPSLTPEEIERRFEYHAVNEEQKAKIAALRQTFIAAAKHIVADVPPGREQATALTKLEEAAFFAIAGVARP